MKSAVVFLDIDGVLNSERGSEKIGNIYGIDYERTSRLAEIVRYMDADIVLSSTWRMYWDPELAGDGVDNWLGSSPKRYGRYINIKLGRYGLKIADKTPGINWYRRAEEIAEWLDNHPEVCCYLILDDEDFGWEKFGMEKHFVATTGTIDHFGLKRSVGLEDCHVAEAISRFDSGQLIR